MEQEYSIELFEEYDNINFYTIRFDGEELTEAEKFISKFPEGCPYDKDVDIVLAWLEKISEKGALERYFRPEGRYGDGVSVIPIEVGYNIRLYCLRLSDKILIIGNGGIKDADKWQNSPVLSSYVRLLIDTSNFVSSRRLVGAIRIVGKRIIGNLNFIRYEKE